jgi:hypothetical protein
MGSAAVTSILHSNKRSIVIFYLKNTAYEKQPTPLVDLYQQ